MLIFHQLDLKSRFVKAYFCYVNQGFRRVTSFRNPPHCTAFHGSILLLLPLGMVKLFVRGRIGQSGSAGPTWIRRANCSLKK